MLTSLITQRDATLETIQDASYKFLSVFSLAQIAIIAFAAFMAGNAILYYVIGSLFIAIVAFFVGKVPNRALAYNSLAVALMGQVCLLVAALKGHHYQIDVHMYFFALLGMLTALLSISAIIFATVTIALHHLILYFLIPIYVFPDESTLFRVGIHAVVVVLEAAVLVGLISLVISALESALAKKKEAETAMEKVTEVEQQRAQTEERAKEEHAEFIQKITQDFRGSVNAAIRDTKQMMEKSLVLLSEMFTIAQEAQIQSKSASESVDEAAHNTSSVAAATEELNAAIAEISEQAQKAASSTAITSSDANNSIVVIERLAQASKEISDIISFINKIAVQINLLALNATIESARAGEAGKGFAVVASEVKTLAGQTENATKRIVDSITMMSSVSEEVSESIHKIITSIEGVSVVSSSIASAVEEQSSATQEISGLVQKVSGSTVHINSNMSKLNNGVSETSDKAKALKELFIDLSHKMEVLDTDAEGFIQALNKS